MDRLVSACATDYLALLRFLILSQLLVFCSEFLVKLLNKMVASVLLLEQGLCCDHDGAVIFLARDGRWSHEMSGLDVGIPRNLA